MITKVKCTIFRWPVLLHFAGLLSITGAVGAVEPVGFNRDVRPILSESCFACHGPDAAHGRQAELRLDEREPAMRGGESGKPAIVPGDPAGSELIRRVTSDNPDLAMPPPDSHFSITHAQRDILTRWIREGAKYEKHWAFVAPEKAETPAKVHPVDHWVDQAIKREQLKPGPPADRRTLLRRLAQDLTGLPPSPGEIARFLADDSPDAYEKQVDRLLGSVHFGEHFAVSWLDAARYADTNGYSIDGGRHQWIWRDWVIDSFNKNQPYDQFLIEQLAGDLLADASESQIVATGFNRNHSITHEGGTIPEENLTNYVADRVKTTSETFLGLTMACAQCHDHKYDPISQRDYYRFFAFFNTLSDKGLDGNAGRNARPSIRASSVLADPAEAEAVRAELAQLQAKFLRPLPAARASWEAAQRHDLEQRGRDLTVNPLKILNVSAPNGNPERLSIVDDATSVTIAGGDFSAYNVLAELPADGPPISGIRLVFLPGKNGHIGYGKKAFQDRFHLGHVSMSTSPYPAGNVDLNALLPVRRLSATTTHGDHHVSEVLVSDPLTGWVPGGDTGAPQHLTLTFAKPLDPAEHQYLNTELLFNYTRGASPQKFQIRAITGHDDGSPHPQEITALLVADPAVRTPEQDQKIAEYFRAYGPEKSALRVQIRNLEERLDMLTKKHPVLVMDTAKEPRRTHILDRGVYSAPLEAVTPGTPEVLPPLAVTDDFDPATGDFKDREATRLDLARWFVRSDHPLTARVAANRLWERFFGRALSVISADLGSQGQWPSHPELLDWLAVEFIESGWDRKHMVRLIVTSDAYRRSSNATPEQLRTDPLNTWLARGPRFRLSAEQIRDKALAVSELLVPRVGGPSVKPYQPGDLWRPISHYGSSPATAQTFIQSHGEKLYRRSLYTYWKRTQPPANLAVFDAPNREVCTIGRIPTNTPLQALVTLNDTQFVEAARAFAERLLRLPDADDAARLSAGFEMVTAREPSAEEMTTLLGALKRGRQTYEQDSSAAHALLSVGESSRDPAMNPVEHAAWTQVASLLLNLSETLTRR